MAHNLSKVWGATLTDNVESVIVNPQLEDPRSGRDSSNSVSSGLDVSRVSRITVICKNNHATQNVLFNVLAGPGVPNPSTGVLEVFDLGYTVDVAANDVGVIDILRYHPFIRIVGTPAGAGDHPVVVYFDGYIRAS